MGRAIDRGPSHYTRKNYLVSKSISAVVLIFIESQNEFSQEP